MRTREYFRIRKTTRRYDRAAGRFYVKIAYETAPPEPSERVLGVAEAFGLGVDEARKFVIYNEVELAIGSRDIVYVTGDSGSGKSVLLKALEQDIRHDADWACVNMAEIKPVSAFFGIANSTMYLSPILVAARLMLFLSINCSFHIGFVLFVQSQI